MNWTDERTEQLLDLRLLIAAVEALNRGSDFLGSVERCIQTAQRLNATDLESGKDSFIDFLMKLAINERQGRAPTAMSGGDG